jgi:hypothetical protein
MFRPRAFEGCEVGSQTPLWALRYRSPARRAALSRRRDSKANCRRNNRVGIRGSVSFDQDRTKRVAAITGNFLLHPKPVKQIDVRDRLNTIDDQRSAVVVQHTRKIILMRRGI